MSNSQSPMLFLVIVACYCLIYLRCLIIYASYRKNTRPLYRLLFRFATIYVKDLYADQIILRFQNPQIARKWNEHEIIFLNIYSLIQIILPPNVVNCDACIPVNHEQSIASCGRIVLLLYREHPTKVERQSWFTNFHCEIHIIFYET